MNLSLRPQPIELIIVLVRGGGLVKMAQRAKNVLLYLKPLLVMLLVFNLDRLMPIKSKRVPCYRSFSYKDCLTILNIFCFPESFRNQVECSPLLRSRHEDFTKETRSPLLKSFY